MALPYGSKTNVTFTHLVLRISPAGAWWPLARLAQTEARLGRGPVIARRKP